jgi:hypothetical protein
MQSPSSLCVYESLLRNLNLKLDMYITAPEPILTLYLINPSQQTVCLYVYPLSLLGNGLAKILPW